MIRKKIKTLIENLKSYKKISKKYRILSLKILKPKNEKYGDYTAEISYIEDTSLIDKVEMVTGGKLLPQEYDDIIKEIRTLSEFQRYFQDVKFEFPIFIKLKIDFTL